MATQSAGDPRKTRAWRALRDQVVQDEPECRLGLPGCTRTSTTADHIKPIKTHPQLAMDRANLRGSCMPCNKKRGATPDREDSIYSAHRPRALDIFRPLNEL